MKIEELTRKESQVTRKEEIFLFNGRTKHGTLPTEFRIGISLRSMTAGRLKHCRRAYEDKNLKSLVTAL